MLFLDYQFLIILLIKLIISYLAVINLLAYYNLPLFLYIKKIKLIIIIIN